MKERLSMKLGKLGLKSALMMEKLRLVEIKDTKLMDNLEPL